MKPAPPLPAWLQAPPPRELPPGDPLVGRSVRRYWLQPKLALGAVALIALAMFLLSAFKDHAALRVALQDAGFTAIGLTVMLAIPMWFYARSNVREIEALIRQADVLEATVVKTRVANALPFVEITFTTRDGAQWGATVPVPTGAAHHHHHGDRLHVLYRAGDQLVGLVTAEGIFIDAARALSTAPSRSAEP